ncbi:EamA family transporter [Maritalea sp.]|uniref:EamA family transporter n=1 Tax=Maritalea sp. TaxID=2003361 RepID=UPI003EF4F26C
MPARDVFLATLVVAIWGLNFVAIKLGVQEVPPLFLTGLRFLFAAIPLVFFVKKPATNLRSIIAYGLCLGAIQFGLLFFAIKLGMSASLSSVAMQLQAFFTIGIAFVVLKEVPKPWQIVGAIIAFLGIAIMGSEQAANAQLVPFTMLIIGALFWGISNIIAKKAGQIDMFSFVIWTSLVPPIPLFAMSWLVEDQTAILNTFTNPTLIGTGAIIFLAYPATIFGFGIWNQLLKKHPASLVAPFSLLVPIFGILSGFLILGETMSPLAIIGGAVIFAGLLLNVFGGRIFARRANKST